MVDAVLVSHWSAASAMLGREGKRPLLPKRMLLKYTMKLSKWNVFA